MPGGGPLFGNGRRLGKAGRPNPNFDRFCYSPFCGFAVLYWEDISDKYLQLHCGRLCSSPFRRFCRFVIRRSVIFDVLFFAIP
jgi:hypothetical protein